MFYFFGVDKGVFLALTYSSIAMRKSDLHSSLRIERWLNCFFIFFERLILTEQNSFKVLDPMRMGKVLARHVPVTRDDNL